MIYLHLKKKKAIKDIWYLRLRRVCCSLRFVLEQITLSCLKKIFDEEMLNNIDIRIGCLQDSNVLYRQPIVLKVQ